MAQRAKRDYHMKAERLPATTPAQRLIEFAEAVRGLEHVGSTRALTKILRT